MEDKRKRQNYSFIHSIFQFLIHCDNFKDFIFNNIFYDAPIITNFISLFYCYNEEMKKRDEKKKIVPGGLKKEMDKYLERNEDPITFLDKIFEILHSYILTNGNVNEFENPENLKKRCEPVCNIHQLFNIDINFNEICSHCKSSSTLQNVYDNNFYFTIKTSDTLKNILEQNYSFQNLYNKLFQISTMNSNKKCPSCKNDTYERSLICYSVQDYFIINLKWDKYNITKANLIKIYCMINSQMNTKDIFSCNYNENYTFFGMIVCQNNNYLNIFYETENNKNCFVLYNYPEKKTFKYLELLNNLIKYKLYPIAIFYEKKNYDENFFFDINEQVYQSMMNNINKKKNNQFIDNINNREEVNNDIKNNSKIINNFSNIKEGKWKCNKCKTENLNSKNKCENCGGTNKIKQKDNVKNWWICEKCQTNNRSMVGKCEHCGNVNNLICSIIKFTKNQSSENMEYDYRNIYNEDNKNKENNPEVKNYYEQENNSEQNIEDNEKNINEYHILNDNENENINDFYYNNNENNNYSDNENNNYNNNENNNYSDNKSNNNYENENNNNENNVDKDKQNLNQEEEKNQQTDYTKEFDSQYFHKSNQQN